MYKISPQFIKSLKFWRKIGNPYTSKLLWYCDSCNMKIEETKYLKHGIDLCVNCK